MRKILALNVVVALAFAVAPHVSQVQELVDLNKASSAFSWMITVGSLLYLLTSTVLLWTADAERQSLQGVRDLINRAVDGPVIQPMRDDEFYRRFLEQIERAEATVMISYFGSQNPGHTRREDRERYYGDLLSVIRRKPQVVFRRLLRDTPENRKWAMARMARWQALPNLSVGLLRDLSAEHDMPLALSVQVIDERISWLVAVEGHERLGRHRDLMVEDPTTAGFMTKYFERLWRHSTLILDTGNVTPEGSKLSAVAEAGT